MKSRSQGVCNSKWSQGTYNFLEKVRLTHILEDRMPHMMNELREGALPILSFLKNLSPLGDFIAFVHDITHIALITLLAALGNTYQFWGGCLASELSSQILENSYHRSFGRRKTEKAR